VKVLSAVSDQLSAFSDQLETLARTPGVLV